MGEWLEKRALWGTDKRSTGALSVAYRHNLGFFRCICFITKHAGRIAFSLVVVLKVIWICAYSINILFSYAESSRSWSAAVCQIRKSSISLKYVDSVRNHLFSLCFVESVKMPKAENGNNSTKYYRTSSTLLRSFTLYISVTEMIS